MSMELKQWKSHNNIHKRKKVIRHVSYYFRSVTPHNSQGISVQIFHCTHWVHFCLSIYPKECNILAVSLWCYQQ
jgi:hypothetical protein